MIKDLEFVKNKYYSIYFDYINILEHTKKTTVKELQNRFDELIMYKEDKNNKAYFKDRYKKSIYRICKMILILENNKISKNDYKTVCKIREDIKEYLDYICLLEIKELEEVYPNAIVDEIFSSDDFYLCNKKSIISYYQTYYMPRHIEGDISSLMKDNPEDEYPDARNMKRHFVLHIGPTNSGKTYNALERLKQCEKGAYFGPLRLLALEVYDKLNMANVPCNMVTGEEELTVPDAVCNACTIEILNIEDYFDIVVIDEAQMINDEYRGYNWTKAILGLKANEIHLCLAPEAKDIIIELISRCNDTYEIFEHKRKTDLIFVDKAFDLKDIEKGDALIVFSKRAVLELAAELQTRKIKASVIYGNLPPASRRNQVAKFTSGETDVVISTDAIGMGLNLPIRRIIFMETEKYDGVSVRKLRATEIKQIAGRAGRMGMYEQGYVLTTSNSQLIKNALNEDIPQIEKVYLGFPESVMCLPFEINELIKVWYSMKPPSIYKKMNVEILLDMYNILQNKCNINDYTKEELYKLITCPIDLRDNYVVDLWINYTKSYQYNSELVLPTQVYSKELNKLETYYKQLDLYFQFSRKMKRNINTEQLKKNKEETVNQINQILEEHKLTNKRRCRYCNKELPFNHKFAICDLCYETRYWY